MRFAQFLLIFETFVSTLVQDPYLTSQAGGNLKAFKVMTYLAGPAVVIIYLKHFDCHLANPLSCGWACGIEENFALPDMRSTSTSSREL
ncbi:uncharacterized protein EAE98_006395 [Botrytis deweyae]|uniref:Uncharacterized protein n=1 Tax=Botrytis deweyae TaxID=2478750 RepID=A0ABQ7IKY4_9HELO|nr:uncharacterized protein EAE98_006395 [Botrytis deweyae]KAF7927011.1 hypothetical protein EAE98_006395 [Botrytis deweyae]KAF7929003.1 hypothetical protein EAE99_004747 [Botrytis elliptica]